MLGYFGSLDSNSKNPVVLRQRESRLAFWRELILSAFRSHTALLNTDPIISAPILKILLRRKNLSPMGIQQIIDDMVERKILVPVDQFLRPQASSWWSTLVGLVSSPAKQTNVQYVLLPILEERVQKLASTFPSGEAILPLDRFLAMTQGVHLDLLSTLLPNTTQFEVKDQKAVKIATKPENAKVSDSDRALFHISTSIQKLEQREAKYARDIQSLRQEVISLLKSGNRPHASMLLRRSKLYEKQLDKAMASRDQLLRIAASIEEAQTSAEVFEAMKLGAAALKTENDRVGGIDKVDSLMDTVAELVEEQDSISEAIGSSTITTAVDEALLEAELAELVKEEDKSPSPSPAISPFDKTLDSLVTELQQVHVPAAPVLTSSSAPMEPAKRAYAS